MIMPCLRFNGNSEEAFHFYANAFGGRITSISRLNNDPNSPVMHAMVILTESGGGVSGADMDNAVPVFGMPILVLLPSRERVEEIIPKLAEGGTLVRGFLPHPPRMITAEEQRYWTSMVIHGFYVREGINILHETETNE